MILNSFLICGLSVSDICSIIGAFTAFTTAFIAVCKYEEHVEKERIQYLLDFGNKYTSDPEIKEVIMFLEELEDDNMYKQEFLTPNNTYMKEALSIHSLEMFMRFIEELELLIRGSAISETAALNLFGHYTIILDQYNMRWPKLGYKEKYWNVYRDFVEKAKKFDYKNVTV
jgi:hypothetical protein